MSNEPANPELSPKPRALLLAEDEALFADDDDDVDDRAEPVLDSVSVSEDAITRPGTAVSASSRASSGGNGGGVAPEEKDEASWSP